MYEKTVENPLIKCNNSHYHHLYCLDMWYHNILLEDRINR